MIARPCLWPPVTNVKDSGRLSLFMSFEMTQFQRNPFLLLVIKVLLHFCYLFVGGSWDNPPALNSQSRFYVFNCVHSQFLYWCGMPCKYAFWRESGKNKEALFHNVCLRVYFANYGWEQTTPATSWGCFLSFVPCMHGMSFNPPKK